MKTTSFRLKDKEIKRLKEMTSEQDREKSKAARELLDLGWEYLMIRRYRGGEISLARLSEKLDKPLSETIDLLAELGIRSPISKEEVLQGYESLKQEY
ncbi:hypothetical protein AKJ62_05020 [candidate division MSBL1 archaeon SCGC-AAA259D14]|uniref:Ribbon-helix-helix protein CopG domain-containing protein n=2 Tax=candidate division MSBL1 TaxID=215777 RepID=A0A133U2V1_9EURY|nr:hypothetical protein AKJ62_05020 [candidate division MSBL1 archaeon SCGC-AAA259D14]KXA94265.1 hypothetical protein AKJ36_03160 [candidate division MSBL1 archaeon SCGC-AAA259I07]